jgi:hypothetical protein
MSNAPLSRTLTSGYPRSVGKIPPKPQPSNPDKNNKRPPLDPQPSWNIPGHTNWLSDHSLLALAIGGTGAAAIILILLLRR